MVLSDNNASSSDLLDRVNSILTVQEERRRHLAELETRLESEKSNLRDLSNLLDNLSKASTLIGNVSDENVQKTLDRITGVINKALALMFRDDPKRIYIRQLMFQNVYPHYKVIMDFGDGVERPFSLEGTGVAQIISFLFTVCLIDARKGRKILVMDELLSGLHPSAKDIIYDLMTALSTSFQFVIVEYGIDIGKQYEVVKTNGETYISEVDGDRYYGNLKLKSIKNGIENTVEEAS